MQTTGANILGKRVGFPFYAELRANRLDRQSVRDRSTDRGRQPVRARREELSIRVKLGVFNNSTPKNILRIFICEDA